jgi:hypothetical protein
MPSTACPRYEVKGKCVPLSRLDRLELAVRALEEQTMRSLEATDDAAPEQQHQAEAQQVQPAPQPQPPVFAPPFGFGCPPAAMIMPLGASGPIPFMVCMPTMPHVAASWPVAPQQLVAPVAAPPFVQLPPLPPPPPPPAAALEPAQPAEAVTDSTGGKYGVDVPAGRRTARDLPPFPAGVLPWGRTQLAEARTTPAPNQYSPKLWPARQSFNVRFTSDAEHPGYGQFHAAALAPRGKRRAHQQAA